MENFLENRPEESNKADDYQKAFGELRSALHEYNNLYNTIPSLLKCFEADKEKSNEEAVPYFVSFIVRHKIKSIFGFNLTRSNPNEPIKSLTEGINEYENNALSKEKKFVDILRKLSEYIDIGTFFSEFTLSIDNADDPFLDFLDMDLKSKFRFTLTCFSPEDFKDFYDKVDLDRIQSLRAFFWGSDLTYKDWTYNELAPVKKISLASINTRQFSEFLSFNAPNLEGLDLEFYSTPTLEELNELSRFESLNYTKISVIDSDKNWDMSKLSLQHLKHIKIPNKAKGLRSFFENNPQIEKIAFYHEFYSSEGLGKDGIDDDFIFDMLELLPNLRYVHIGDSFITDKGLEYLLDYEKLDVIAIYDSEIELLDDELREKLRISASNCKIEVWSDFLCEKGRALVGSL